MNIKFDTEKTIGDLIDLKRNKLLQVNHEYQRGLRWTPEQKRMFIDSIFRGYAIPAFYFHRDEANAAGITNTFLYIVDGQQRIDAIYEYSEGAFSLFDPADDSTFRFPTFAKHDDCPWGGKRFSELSDALQSKLRAHEVIVYEITTENENSIRDLFIRLQGGTPLSPQDKRDSWPGNFTEFVLKVGGKHQMAKYPGCPLFKDIARGDDSRMRQLAAQVFMLFWHLRHETRFVDIDSRHIDEFYHAHVGFDDRSSDARQFETVCTKLSTALPSRPKLPGHYVIHLVLLADMLNREYTKNWVTRIGTQLREFERRRDEAVKAEKTGGATEHPRYYSEYGQLTQTQANGGITIRRRHAFFAEEMMKLLNPKRLDEKQTFSEAERKIVFFRDRELCQWCHMDGGVDHKVGWDDCVVHHVRPDGAAELSNAALIHRKCQPEVSDNVEGFQRWWEKRSAGRGPVGRP